MDNRTLSLVFLLAALIAASCDSPPAAKMPTPKPATSAAPPASETDADNWPSDSIQRLEFIADYAGLEKIGTDDDILLYPRGSAEVVDKVRSELPTGDPLHVAADDEANADDRVLVLWKTADSSYYVIHTDGASGDPGFYLVNATTHNESPVVLGEILALPGSGKYSIYQRTNSFFPKRKDIRVENGALTEVPAERYPVNLRTIALDTMSVFRSEHDSTVVVTLQRGDSIEIVAAGDSAATDGYPIWLRTSPGISGWVSLEMPQCPAKRIRGLCFLGD